MRSPPSKQRRGQGVLLASAVVCVVACTAERPGQLIVSVQTDLAVPKDINTLRIDVEQFGRRLARLDHEIRPFSRDGVYLPGSLGIVSGERDDPVTLRISSKKKFEPGLTSDDAAPGSPIGEFRTLREVVTKVPQHRVVALPITFEWLCWEDPSASNAEREFFTQEGDEVRSACPADSTCIAGTCRDNAVEESELEDYAEGETPDPNDPVLPGAEGTCFDTLPCFQNATDLLLIPERDAEDNIIGCTADVESTRDLNIAMVTGAAGNAGVCYEAGSCLVPLDASTDAGWRAESNNVVTLPASVCRRLEQGRVLRVIATNTCESKEGTPTCGEWFSDLETSSEPAQTTTTTDGGTPNMTSDGGPPVIMDPWLAREGSWDATLEEMSDPERGNYVIFSGQSSSSASSIDTGTLLAFFPGDGQDVDASESGGVRFFAQANRDVPLLVSAPPSELIPEDLGGICTEPCAAPAGVVLHLSPQWQAYELPFSTLLPAAAGYSSERVAAVMFFPLDDAPFDISMTAPAFGPPMAP